MAKKTDKPATVNKQPVAKKQTQEMQLYTPPVFTHGLTEQEAVAYIGRRIAEHRTSNKKAGWTDEDLYIRHQLIINWITQGMAPMDIIRHIRNVWECAQSSASLYVKQAMQYLTQMSDEYRDNIRDAQIAKISRWAEECRLMGKYLEASKFTDQLNKMIGAYSDRKVEVTSDGQITVTFTE